MVSAACTQLDRQIGIHTPLGEDALLLVSFQGEESISSPFRFRLDLLSEIERVDPRDIVGKAVAFYVQEVDGSRRYFHGMVRRFEYRGRNDRLYLYGAEIVPWMWFLSQRSDCRIFQQKTTVQILEEVFLHAGFADFRFEVSRALAPREYCVQYRESDLDFVSRLLEEDGIFYYVQHEADRHTLVLADHCGAYTLSRQSVARIASTLSSSDVTDEILRWEHHHEFQSGRWTMRDFDFANPRCDLTASVETVLDLRETRRFERYDYPGRYVERREGEKFAELQAEADEALYNLRSGTSMCRSFGPGCRFRLDGPGAGLDAGREFVIRSIRHEASLAGAYLTGGPVDAVEYRNDFECIPDDVVYRPRRLTPRPVIAGPQTAIVVGPPGEELYVDQYARIKVQFHWDRVGQRNEHSSCWIRVSQPWAGGGFGGLAIPRVGQEVIVEFLEGDPDRPIVTGRVYNGENMPPVSNAGRNPDEFPDPEDVTRAAMMTTIRSQTVGGGGFNEITMNDTPGGEGLFFKAQKDEIHNVGNDRTTTIGNNESTNVGVDRTEEIGSNETRTIGANRSQDVGANDVLNVGADKTINVGSNLLINAGTSITLKCGASTITMNAGGVITIAGTIVTMTGAANANVAAPITNIAGAALLTQTGAVNLISGIVTRMDAASTAVVTSGGKAAVEAGGDAIIKGSLVKLNG